MKCLQINVVDKCRHEHKIEIGVLVFNGGYMDKSVSISHALPQVGDLAYLNFLHKPSGVVHHGVVSVIDHNEHHAAYIVECETGSCFGVSRYMVNPRVFDELKQDSSVRFLVNGRNQVVQIIKE